LDNGVRAAWKVLPGAFYFSASRREGIKMTHSRSFAFSLFAALMATTSAYADDLVNLFKDGRPVVDLRGRLETVDDASKTGAGNAYTLRARLGYETGSWNGLSVQFDFDQIWALGDTTYNSTRNGKTSLPVIADPAMTALNRLQLSYKSDFDTTFVVGRQRLLIGNQRFVGNSGWRQHEQTFDALSAVNKSIPDLALTYAYLYRINRVYGPDEPVPTATAPIGQANYFKSDSHIFDGVYIGVPGLRLEGYSFLLDLNAPGYATTPALLTAASKLSTATYGGRGDYTINLDDMSGKLSGEYAHQTNYRNNPLSFGLDYFLGEGSVTWQGLSGLVGYESLGGNGVIGFSTPLATLHAFNGWADMFLTTPVNGLDDLYFKLGYVLPADFVMSKTLNLNATYHDYTADHVGHGIGSEWDLQAELTVDASLSFMAKYANYAGSGVAFGGFPDKSIFWLQTAYKY
jgi:hypothetical protein